MKRVFLTMLAVLMLPLLRAEEPVAVKPEAAPEAAAVAKTGKTVVVIPVREGIDNPILYVLRRGMKEAIEKKADVVVLACALNNETRNLANAAFFQALKPGAILILSGNLLNLKGAGGRKP